MAGVRPALVFLSLAAIACGPAFASVSPVNPSESSSSGGIDVRLRYSFFNSANYQIEIAFGGEPATNVEVVVSSRDPESGQILGYELACTVPPHAAGTVDVVVSYVPYPGYDARPDDLLPAAFTYLAAPTISSISPDEHSIKKDLRVCTIKGMGFSTAPGLKVYFGEEEATEVTVDSIGQKITCMPPDFPGGTWPQSVDVRVVNPDGEEVRMPNAFVYTQIAPVIQFVVSSYQPAWRSELYCQIHVVYFVEGNVDVYVNKLYNGRAIFDGEVDNNVVGCFPPPQPPGWASITLVNGDGGVYTLDQAIYFHGTASTDYHTADIDQDFRFNLAEVLRIVQLYNVGEFHCESGTEDGYAPGPGDQSCAPHASDNAPQDWKISLSELLGIIQLYNSLCYQPCPGAPGTYCPPD